MTMPRTMASAASSIVTGTAFLRLVVIGSPVKSESPGLRLTICQTQSAYCSWYGRSRRSCLRTLARSRSLTLPDSPISRVSASPGITRIKPNTISDDSSKTGTASSSRRSTYLYIVTRRLLVEPGARERRRAVAVRAPQGGGRRIAHVRLEDHEPVVVRHPHPRHLVELPLHDLPGECALLRDVGRLAQLGREVVDHRVVDAEEVL